MKKENVGDTRRMERMMSICMPRVLAEKLMRLAMQKSLSRSALIRLALMKVYENELSALEDKERIQKI